MEVAGVEVGSAGVEQRRDVPGAVRAVDDDGGVGGVTARLGAEGSEGEAQRGLARNVVEQHQAHRHPVAGRAAQHAGDVAAELVLRVGAERQRDRHDAQPGGEAGRRVLLDRVVPHFERHRAAAGAALVRHPVDRVAERLTRAGVEPDLVGRD